MKREELLTIFQGAINSEGSGQLPIASGVYALINRVTGRVYIGESNNLRSRVGAHYCILRAGRHSNKRLQAEWKDGSFVACVIVLCHEEDRRPMEKLCISQLLGDGCYNHSKGAEMPPSYYEGMLVARAANRRKKTDNHGQKAALIRALPDRALHAIAEALKESWGEFWFSIDDYLDEQEVEHLKNEIEK